MVMINSRRSAFSSVFVLLQWLWAFNQWNAAIVGTETPTPCWSGFTEWNQELTVAHFHRLWIFANAIRNSRVHTLTLYRSLVPSRACTQGGKDMRKNREVTPDPTKVLECDSSKQHSLKQIISVKMMGNPVPVGAPALNSVP